ncbi:MAG TPA: hypothetical protein VFW64_21025, partial [Pseudonocardiaceae bacterium]|nr:hypothetical protein [Pseudonocardiaceae bacterium]
MLHLSPRCGRRTAAPGHPVVDPAARHPLDAVASGAIDLPRARAISQATVVVDAATTAAAQTRVL